MSKKMAGMVAVLLAVAFCLSACTKAEKQLTDTEKWFNTSYAVLITANEGDMSKIGGESKERASTKIKIKVTLEQSWDVTDRASAQEALADLLGGGGMREGFNAEMQGLKDSGFFEFSEAELEQMFNEQKGEEGVDLLKNAVSCYKQFGDDAIAAWDYCRAIQLLGYFYLADFYTEQEALDQSLEIAKAMQGKYESWDQMMESYLCGFQYWQEDDSTDLESATAEREKIYQQLKSSPDNPYQLDWNTELVKTW